MGNEIEDALNDDLMQAIKKEDGLLHAKIDYDEFYLDWGTAGLSPHTTKDNLVVLVKHTGTDELMASISFDVNITWSDGRLSFDGWEDLELDGDSIDIQGIDSKGE